MARKEGKADAGSHGLDDVIGLLLIFGAALLLLALLSYDPKDIASNSTKVNQEVHNLIGTVGAHIAFGLFLTIGAAAYLIPPLSLMFGLARFLEGLSYLKGRWPWALALVFACMGMLHLYYPLFDVLAANLNLPSPGGLIGKFSCDYFFSYLGQLGATLIFAAIYLISFLYLTNFHLGEWAREAYAAWQYRAEHGQQEEKPTAAEEMELERRARDLEKQARKLKEQVEEVERSGLGADLQPVPEPTVRDLSVPQARPAEAPAKASRAKPKPAPEPPVEPVEVIPAREIAAATTADILGKPAEAKPAGPPLETLPAPEPVPAENPFVVVAGTETAAAPETAPPAVEPSPPAVKPKPAPRRPKPITVAATPKIGNYQYPPHDFLQHPDMTVKPTESKEELMANARLMQNTLAQFDIEVSLGDITKGPTITRYELHPAPGVKLEKITALNNNIAAALKAERIHILAPVPGKSSVGVEVPNLIKTKVIMRDLLESEEWQTSKARIPLALGKDVYGHPIVADLAEMPHLLIAGSTGSGKSVCINAIVASLLYKFSPEQLRFVMIDPKVVELQQYNSLPHLVVPVVNDPKKVILALRWVVNEMEKRYQIFAKVGVRNIKSFNERPKHKPKPEPELELPLTVKKEKIEAGADGFAVEVDEEIVVPREDDIVIPDKLSYIVVIIDELADLMLVAPADVEMAIARITQMARAAGIHCIVATQRPSVDVITGVIKANIPARIAFQVAAKVDSRTILDAMGADKLLGKGDMLYLPPGSAKLIRAQGVLITDPEIQQVVDFISGQGKPSYEVEIHQQLSQPANGLEGENGCDEDEDLIQQCIEVIRSEQKASVSLMQRRLRLGYTRAARIMDELENRGIVGPSKGAEPRDILIDLDDGGADGKGQ